MLQEGRGLGTSAAPPPPNKRISIALPMGKRMCEPQLNDGRPLL